MSSKALRILLAIGLLGTLMAIDGACAAAANANLWWVVRGGVGKFLSTYEVPKESLSLSLTSEAELGGGVRKVKCLEVVGFKTEIAFSTQGSGALLFGGCTYAGGLANCSLGSGDIETKSIEFSLEGISTIKVRGVGGTSFLTFQIEGVNCGQAGEYKLEFENAAGLINAVIALAETPEFTKTITSSESKLKLKWAGGNEEAGVFSAHLLATAANLWATRPG